MTKVKLISKSEPSIKLVRSANPAFEYIFIDGVCEVEAEHAEIILNEFDYIKKVSNTKKEKGDQ